MKSASSSSISREPSISYPHAAPNLAGEGAGSITRDATGALGPKITIPGGFAQNALPERIGLALCGGGEHMPWLQADEPIEDRLLKILPFPEGVGNFPPPKIRLIRNGSRF